MAKPRVRIVGGDEVIKALKRKAAEADEALEATAQAAAEPIRDRAEDYAARLTGNLADNIKAETLEKGRGSVVVGVGPDDEEAWYGGFVELGTGPKQVRPEQAKALEMEDDSFAAFANAAGSPAQPYLRPALDDEEDHALEAAAEVIRRALKLERP